MFSSLPVHGGRLAALICIAGVAWPEAVAAQSLFESLFGAPKPAMRAPAGYPGAQRLLPPGAYIPAPSIAVRPAPARQERDDDDDDGKSSARSGGKGGHHTVCVRLCDGFYWPISYSAPRSKFYRDANVCSSSCATEAKLFHYPTSGGDVKDAVDLGGRVYGRLPTAFKYRKALVQGCTCKAEPWSQAEIDRHRIYALNEEAAKGGAAPATNIAALPISPPSGTQASGFVGDATDGDEAASAPATSATSPASPVADQSAPPPKPTRTRTAEATHSRQRSRSQAPLPPLRIKAATGPVAGGFWGGGAPKYAWPGDAPARMR